MAFTGRLLKRQVDRNPQSATYLQTRLVDAGVDTVACPLPATFRSALISENVTRNDCPSGQFGTTVAYTLGAGSFTSTVSQADADAQARVAFDAQKQAFANQYGACSFTPGGSVVWVPQYLPGGCFACTMANQDDPSDVRSASAEEVAAYFRPQAGNASGQLIDCDECQLS